MKKFLNDNKFDIFFCLSFSSAFSLYFWDFIKIKNYFFIPIIYKNSHVLFLLGVFYLFFLFFMSFGILNYSKRKVLFYDLLIVFLLILSIESIKDYFAISVNKYLYICFILLLIISTFFKNFSNNFLTFLKKLLSCFFLFYFVLIYIGINKFFERNYNFNNLENLKNKKDKMNIVIVFDELDWRILNEEKYQKYNFNLNFQTLLKNSVVYDNSFIKGNQTKTNLPSIINNETYNLDEINLMIKNFKKNKLNKIVNHEDNLFKKLKEKDKSIGYVGYYFQECKIFKKKFDYCHYLNNGFRDLKKFPKDFILYNFNKINPINKKDINFNNFFKRQYNNFETLNNVVLEELINSNLDVIFMHIPFPHGPYIYDIKKNKFDDIYLDKNYDRNKEVVKHEYYIGNIYIADSILKKIFHLEKKYKKKINYFILSDTGINKDLDDYTKLNSSKYSTNLKTGHTVLFYKKFDSTSKKIIEEKKFSPGVLHEKLFSFF